MSKVSWVYNLRECYLKFSLNIQFSISLIINYLMHYRVQEERDLHTVTNNAIWQQ